VSRFDVSKAHEAPPISTREFSELGVLLRDAPISGALWLIRRGGSMTGRHAKQGRWGRVAIAMVGVGVATAGVLVATAAPSNAAPFSTSCRARAVAFDGPKPIVIGTANNGLTPCVTDYSALADATASIVGVNPLVTIGAHLVNDGTAATVTQGNGGQVTTSSASSDIARVTVNGGPGLKLIVEGIHSQANAEATEFDGACTENTSGSSYVAKLTVNGKQYKVLDKPLTIKLPLRITIYVNRQVVTNHQLTQDVVYIQWPDKRYDIAIGESTAGTLCNAP
jgi:hypothetical protein